MTSKNGICTCGKEGWYPSLHADDCPIWTDLMEKAERWLEKRHKK